MTRAQQYAAAARSFVTTAIAVVGGLIGVAAIPGVTIPPSWIAAATVTVAILRTALSALDSAMPLFGRGVPDAELLAVGDESVDPLFINDVTGPIEGD